MMLLRDAPRTAVVWRCERGGAGWPGALDALRDAPRELWLRGQELPAAGRTVAIVGSRTATAYGLTLAQRLARDLASHGVTIVSGLAHGIDAAAHRGALEGRGRTVAVLASGVTCPTPADHVELAEQVVAAGTLVSERRDGGPFGRGAFVRRNRIIAALAAVTVVVEAGLTSGALHTAARARVLGRTVFAVPGDVDRAGSQGPLRLLREGARPCADAADVLACLAPSSTPSLDPAARLLAALTNAPRTVEAIAAHAALTPADALARLLRLQWSGLAVTHPGGRWSTRA
jgi:DNA processing protein